MRLIDLLESSLFEELDIKRQAQKDIVNYITPLISAGKDKVPVASVIEFLNNEPEYQGTIIDNDLILSVASCIKPILKVERNPEDGGEMYIYFLNSVKSDRYVNKDQKEVEKEKIKKSAMNTVKRNLSK